MAFQIKDGLDINGSTFVDSSKNITANNTTLTGELHGPATFVIDPTVVGDNTGLVVIKGDLQVDGTTTTINSTTITVDDKNIVLASGSINAAAADGAGITIDGASATLNYASSGDKWVANKSVETTQLISTVATGTAPLTVTSTTAVTNLNADLLDGQHGSYYSGLVDAEITARIAADVTVAANAANASNLTSGTVAPARLGTGTANTTTFLRGDNSWQTISTAISAADNQTNATYYPIFATSQGTSVTLGTDVGMTYNPSTGTLTATTFSGALSGNATTATTATYLSTTQQTNSILGSQSSMSMAQDGGVTRGSISCRATGTGDANLAGMSFWNDAYAVKLGIRADGFFGLGGWSRAAWSWYSGPSGDMVAAGNVTAYSDPRLKENFEKIQNPLTILQALDGGTFNWKSGFAHTEVKAGKKDYGVLADQVEAVMPEIVTDSIEIEGEKYKTVDYSKLVPVLLEAIKELNARIIDLESKLGE
jgi:hypothetical protein